MIQSLEESVDLVWNGEVDIGDGKCQKLHKEYMERITIIEAPSLLDLSSIQYVLQYLQKLLIEILADLEFLFERRLTVT